MDHRIVYIGNQRCALYSGVNRCTLPIYSSRVEYLETTGSQYIALKPMLLPDIITLEYKAKCSNLLNYNSRICSYGTIVDKNNFSFWENRTKFIASVLGKENEENVNNSILHTVFFTRTSITSAICSYNGNIYNFTGNYVAKLPNTFNLFCSGYITQFYIGKIYYIKFYSQNNTPIFHFIPVRVGNIGYLFDTISGKLFANAGTGNFILGPDITD